MAEGPCCAHLFSAQWWADWAAEPSVDHEKLLEPDGPLGQPSDNGLKLKAFVVGRVLGTGAFSTVRLGTHRASGRTYALKLVDKQKSNAKSIAHEVSLMRCGGAHAHVVSLFDHFELARAWVLVLELVSGGEVFDRICSRGAYSERDAAAPEHGSSATHTRVLPHAPAQGPPQGSPQGAPGGSGRLYAPMWRDRATMRAATASGA